MWTLLLTTGNIIAIRLREWCSVWCCWCSWFVDCSRDKSEAILSLSRQFGSFLLRPTNSSDKYALSYRSETAGSVFVFNCLSASFLSSRSSSQPTGCKLEMTMGMAFPLGMGIPWESHGNGTNIESVVRMEMGMQRGLDENGNNAQSHENLGNNSYRWLQSASLQYS